jgi:hypothetical protein
VAHKAEVCSHGSAGGPPGGYNAIGLRLWATDGSGIALQIFPAGATRSAIRRAENPATRLITIWSDEKRSPDRTSSATCGRTARTTVSDPSSTSWLEAHTETLSNRLASPAATPALRGDKRMVRRAPPSEFRPLTMAAAMAPVPMNPRIIEIYSIVPDGSGRRRALQGCALPTGRVAACAPLLAMLRRVAGSGPAGSHRRKGDLPKLAPTAAPAPFSEWPTYTANLCPIHCGRAAGHSDDAPPFCTVFLREFRLRCSHTSLVRTRRCQAFVAAALACPVGLCRRHPPRLMCRCATAPDTFARQTIRKEPYALTWPQTTRWKNCSGLRPIDRLN